MMKIILHLLTTYAIFSLFFVNITLLGGIFIYILQKYGKRKWNLSLLEYSFISFAVGILIYIVFGYLLSFFKVFNFYTAYLPLLVLAAGFLFVLYFNKTLHKIWAKLIIQLKSKYKELIIYGSILCIIFLFQFLTYLPMILEDSGLLGADSYYWTRQTLYLNQNELVNYHEHWSTYPWGFIIYCGGNLLISPDFTTTYYFMKFACFPFLNLYILIMFSISKRLFKERFLIFYCLLAVLSNIYFLSRTFSFLSSTLSILLILISLIIFLTRVPNYFLGFIVAAIFLFNPAYSFLYILMFLIFYTYKILTSQKTKKMIFRELAKIAITSFIFLSIYGFSVIFIYRGNLISILISFFKFSTIEAFTISFTPVVIEEINVFNLILGAIYSITFLILPILGIIIKTKGKKEKKRKDIYLFMKICVLLTFVIVYILPIFIKTGFFDTYYTRTLEAFFPCIILLSGISIYKLKFYLENQWQRLKTSKVKFNNWINSVNLFNRILNFPNIIIFTIILASFLNLIYVRDNLYMDYRFDDSLIDSVFYVENNLEGSSNIGVGANYRNNTFQETHSPFGLLYNYNLFSYSEEYNLTITEFTNFWQVNNVEYFIIKLSEYNVDLCLHIENETLYERLAGGTSGLEFQLYRIL